MDSFMADGLSPERSFHQYLVQPQIVRSLFTRAAFSPSYFLNKQGTHEKREKCVSTLSVSCAPF